MRYCTVCSGIECASVALQGLGWEPVFFSEIEPFPCELLAYRYPSVPNLGDMTKISYDKEKDVITNGTIDVQLHGEPIDVLLGGTPCQDVSVAGKRAGMQEGSGTRSSLAFHFVRLADELRPRWLVWENVPGVFSSDGGRDFARFVQALAEIGYSVGWRVLDAQYSRVDAFPRAIPQRRRRCWLVACPGDDRSALEEVLFEREGSDRDPAPRRETWKEFASEIAERDRGHDSDVEGWPPVGNGGDASDVIDASYYKGPGFRGGHERTVVAHPTNSNGENVMPTLCSEYYKAPNQQSDKGGAYVLQPKDL